MKKMFLVMALLMLAVPAMAAVTVTATDAGDGSGLVTVSYTGSDVRAFALDITVDGGAVISDVNALSADYYVNPGSVNVAGDGSITGSLVCDAGQYAGTLDGEGTSGITTEQGSLYVGAVNAPAASGDLFSFVVDADCHVTIAVNAIRAGVVMEDPDADPGLTIVECDVDVDEPCGFDLANSDGVTDPAIGGPDGQVDMGDLSALIMEMMSTSNAGINWLVANPAFAGADIANSDGVTDPAIGGPDGQVDMGDLSALIMQMMSTSNAGINWLVDCY